jgi:hypothetical protein
MAINFQDLLETFGAVSSSERENKPKQKPTLENIVGVIYRGSTEKAGPWIAGGCGRQVAIGETTFNDIDVWFKDVFQFEQASNRLHDAFGYEMYETYNSANAITYQVGNYKVQLIRRAYYPNLDAVFKSFDFTCCQVALDDNLTSYGPGVEDAVARRLVLNNFDPKAFLARYAKYVGYGYVMDSEAFVEIIERKDLNYEFDGSVFGY